MAVAVFVRFPGIDPDRYDAVIAGMNLDVDPPAGAILHVAAEEMDGVSSCDVWQTRETFEAYYNQRLRPALREQRIRDDPEVRIVPLHNLYAADISTLERIGAVSLPAHAAGYVR